MTSAFERVRMIAMNTRYRKMEGYELARLKVFDFRARHLPGPPADEVQELRQVCQHILLDRKHRESNVDERKRSERDVDFDFLCLATSLEANFGIKRAYGEQQTDSARQAALLYGKGNVQVKFEDYRFSYKGVECGIGVNSGWATKVSHEKALDDLKDGLRSVHLQHHQLAAKVGIQTYVQAPIPMLQVVEGSVNFLTLEPVDGDILVIRERGTVDLRGQTAKDPLLLAKYMWEMQVMIVHAVETTLAMVAAQDAGDSTPEESSEDRPLTPSRRQLHKSVDNQPRPPHLPPLASKNVDALNIVVYERQPRSQTLWL